MKKLIFAIATVFCLQLGLVLYTAIDQRVTDDETRIVAVLEPIATSVTPVATFDERADELTSGAPSYSRRHRTPFPPRYSARIDDVSIERVSAPPKPIVISYSRKGALVEPNAAVIMPAEALTGQPPMPRIQTRRSEKRSFLAKAQPVIKKPYDWLKAIASKLK